MLFHRRGGDLTSGLGRRLSLHVLRRLSAAVLAAVWLYFYPAAGCVMVGIALLICCLRVLTGVHHVRDVVCGFALGFALGCAGMWLL